MVSAPPILKEPPTRNLPNVAPRRIEGETIPPELLTFLDFAGRRIETELLAPLLEAEDVATAFRAGWDTYVSLTNAVSNAVFSEVGLDSIVRFITDEEDSLRTLFNERAEEALGQPAYHSVLDALDLQTLARESMLEIIQKEAEHVEPKPMGDMGTLEIARGLCLAAVAYHLSTGKGQQSNASTLASWSYYYADLANAEWGLLSLDLGLGTKLER